MADYQSGEARLAAMGMGSIYPPGQYADIIRATVASPEPPELAEEFGLEQGHELIVRTRVTYQNGAPVSLSTSHFHPKHAHVAPDLLTRERITQGTVRYLADILGTRVGISREQVWADSAESDSVPVLLLNPRPNSVFTALLFGQTWWSTPEGELLELGCSVTLPRLRKTFERVIA